MKICVLGLRGFPLVEGGVEKHCESLYPRMNQEITVIRRKPYITEACAAASQYNQIRFVDLPSTTIKGVEALLHSFLATRRAIRLKPDVVHIHNIGPALFSGMLSKRKIPVIMTYHSPNYEHNKWGRLAKRLLLYSEKVALKNSNRIIFVNRFQMEKYSEEIRAKSVYIPNGINEPVRLLSTSYLQEIGVKAGKYILAVGRITPEKGFDTLIKGFRAAKHDGYQLVIAGSGKTENGYINELKKLAGNDVIFTGYVYGDKLAQLYTHAALYVLSSNNEGFPLVLLEAMSYNLDVLVSDIPATHLVKLGGDDFFPCGDDQALSEKLSQRLQKPQKREYELEEYNWNAVAAKTLEVYELAHRE